MGLLDLDLDLTRPRKVKAVGMFVCAALVAVVVLVMAVVSSRPAVLWVLLAVAPFALAGFLWFRADQAALAAEQRGQNPFMQDDVR